MGNGKGVASCFTIMAEFTKVVLLVILGEWECDYKHGEGYEKFPN